MNRPDRRRKPHPRRSPAADKVPRKPAPDRSPAIDGEARESWDAVAHWYDRHLDDPDSHHSRVLWPGLQGMLEDLRPGRALELGCGQGFFARRMAATGWQVTAVDIASQMIDAARERGPAAVDWRVDDACSLQTLADAPGFDLVFSIMNLQNMRDAAEAVAAGARRLQAGGAWIGVILHPAFRIPRSSSWGWDAEGGIQYRRLDAYRSVQEIPIEMHPGQRGGPRTLTFHRPLAWYVEAFAAAGLRIDRLAEWSSHRRSTSGHRATAENRAREEFPLFLALRGRRPD